MYRINILDEAVKDLKRLDTTIAARIISKIYWLAENFENTKHESLSCEFAHLFKLRVGDYRILYDMKKKDELIIIHLIGHRSEIYE